MVCQNGGKFERFKKNSKKKGLWFKSQNFFSGGYFNKVQFQIRKYKILGYGHVKLPTLCFSFQINADVGVIDSTEFVKANHTTNNEFK